MLILNVTVDTNVPYLCFYKTATCFDSPRQLAFPYIFLLVSIHQDGTKRVTIPYKEGCFMHNKHRLVGCFKYVLLLLLLLLSPSDFLGLVCGKTEKRTSKKNVDRSTSSHGNKEFGTRSMEKQRGMEFGLWKMATAVMKQDGWMDGWMDG